MRFDRICSVLIVELSRFYHAEGDSSGVNECNGDLSPVGVDVGERKFVAGLRIGRSPFYTRFAMRKLRFCFISCVLLAFSCGLQAQSGFVHTSGIRLVDSSGKPLLLRGINLGNWFVPEGYMFHFKNGPQSPGEIEGLTKELIGPEKAEAFWREWRENYITEQDIDRIKSQGFNSVRVPFHWKFFDRDDGEGFRLIDRLVQWARKDGIYIILDMHCAPGGQTGTNIDDSWGYPWLFRSRGAQDHTLAVWRRIAAHYSKEPIVLGYDL